MSVKDCLLEKMLMARESQTFTNGNRSVVLHEVFMVPCYASLYIDGELVNPDVTIKTAVDFLL